MSELLELQTPLSEIEKAELLAACSLYRNLEEEHTMVLTDAAVMYLRRLLFDHNRITDELAAAGMETSSLRIRIDDLENQIVKRSEG